MSTEQHIVGSQCILIISELFAFFQKNMKNSVFSNLISKMYKRPEFLTMSAQTIVEL